MKVNIHAFFISVLVLDDWLGSRLRRITQVKQDPDVN